MSSQPPSFRHRKDWGVSFFGVLLFTFLQLSFLGLGEVFHFFESLDSVWRTTVVVLGIIWMLLFWKKPSALREWGLSLFLMLQIVGASFSLVASGLHPHARLEWLMSIGCCLALPVPKLFILYIFPVVLFSTFGLLFSAFEMRWELWDIPFLLWTLFAMILGYGLWFLNDREVRYYKKRFKDWQDKVSFANADAFEKNERFEHALASLKKSHRDKQEREFDLHYYEGLILDLARENERKTEEERLSLADQLHDTVKQSLAIAKLKCDTLLMEFDDPQLKEVSVHLGQAIREARDVVQQMSLKILDEFGLETGLEDLVEQFRNHHGMRVKYVYDASSEFHCSLVMGKHIYHSVQECLNNVLKHGPLPEASVHIEEMGHQLRVLIKNTKGANKTSHVDAEDGGYGLFRIEQRCRQLGGRMDILDEASHFAVDMRLPLQEAV